MVDTMLLVGFMGGIYFILTVLPAIPPVLWMIFVTGSIVTEGVLGVIRAIFVLSVASLYTWGIILDRKSVIVKCLYAWIFYTYRVGIVGWITKVAGIQVESEISMYLILLAIAAFQGDFISISNKYWDTKKENREKGIDKGSRV